jgi:hypothetical protein
MAMDMDRSKIILLLLLKNRGLLKPPTLKNRGLPKKHRDNQHRKFMTDDIIDDFYAMKTRKVRLK